MLITESTIQETVDRLANKTEHVRANYRRFKEDILADTTRTDEWKQEQIGHENAKANDKIKTLKQELDEFVKQAQERLNTRLFGFTSTASSQDIIAYRDAVDRAEALKDQPAALDMLERAVRTKDTTLQQALLESAVARGWGRVLDRIAEHRPAYASDLDLLQKVTHLNDNVTLQIHFTDVPR